ncbi:serine/threonine-protein kinase [Stieleria maiorica]|uniref:serine/threonine-protein kinase n=1 Tax=Stieleria maiorica TaxID=2795974 RepID=UPI0011CC954F|nr:serine/threonine-protein kinase [Stieleria maiorica]
MDYSFISDLSVEPSATRHLSDAQKDRMTLLLDRYLSALEQDVPPALEELAVDDPELIEPLRCYINGLEDLHRIAAGFAPHGATDAAADDEKRLGDFRLLEEVGRGGMGVVYRARQLSLERIVAIKLLPFAAVLDARQIARFKNEAHAAAGLNHPNIVPVYTVGVQRGVHYYAMQFIEGRSLDAVIADQSARGEMPDVDDSLRRAIDVAQALHAAHEFGVVHRDIKPSNLILDKDDKIWVTDFGLARCQTDASMTKTGDIVGTMKYMSPEQARGESAIVDGRTDVYSLGATLYEMLCLRPAYDGNDTPAVLRQIEERSPTPLRSQRAKIPQDLETVIAKAMSKSRDDRYETALQFAEDLQRVLDGQPTVARPPTLVDRLAHWAHAHRNAVAMTFAFGLFTLLGLSISIAMIASAKQESDANAILAKRSDRLARATVDRLGAQMAELLSDIPAASSVRQQLLRETLTYYQAFAEQADDDETLTEDLAITFGKIGSLQNEIGSPAEAIASLEESMRLFQQLADAGRPNATLQNRLASSENNLALALDRAGRYQAAQQHYESAIQRWQDLSDADPADVEARAGWAMAVGNFALLLSKTDRPDQAEAMFHRSLEIAQSAPSAASVAPNAPLAKQLASTYQNLSGLLAERDPGQAVSYARAALEYQMRELDDGHASPTAAARVALTLNSLGAAQSACGESDAAIESYRQASELQQQLIGRWPGELTYQRDLAVTQNNLGMALAAQDQFDSARRAFDQALNYQVALTEAFADDAELQSTLGGIYNNHAFVLEKLNRHPQALDSYRLAVQHQQRALLAAPEVPRYREYLSKHFYNCARLLRESDHFDQAVQFALQRRDLWPDDGDRLASVAEELLTTAQQIRQSVAANRPSQAIASDCIDHAKETLKTATEVGYQHAADLLNRPEFAELMQKQHLDET